MNKSPQSFFDAYNGKGVNRGVGWNDSAFGYQCVAGFKAYCEYEDVPVIPTGNGWADGYWYERFNNGMSQFFEYIEDVNDLKCGDWCIWARGSDSSCPNSHIAMYWKGINGTHAQFFGQNQNGHPYFDLQNIKLDILGAYRLRENPSPNINMYGIDVSQHNDINLDISPYDFVIIRACWGTNIDEKAIQWKEKCESLGIPYGVYLYSYSLSEQDAIDEANYICDYVKDWNIQIGIWIDMESDSYKQEHRSWNRDLCSIVCKRFCQTVQARGYYTGIYASESVFGTMIVGCDEFDKWVASWGTNDGTIQRDTSYMGTMLQYTSRAGEGGSPLDGNVSYCELAHYQSHPIHDDTPSHDEDEDKKEEGGDVPVMPDDDYLFKMSNRMYDFLNWLVHIVPLFITLYIALANIWKWQYTESIIATISAVTVFINSILKQSTIGYNQNKKGDGK